jgi:hypothetical protein
MTKLEIEYWLKEQRQKISAVHYVNGEAGRLPACMQREYDAMKRKEMGK